MAVTKGTVAISIKIDGDNKKATATIKGTEDDLQRLGTTAGSVGDRIARAMGGGEQSFLGIKSAAGAALGKMGLIAAGARTIASGFTEMTEAIQEGAAAGDRLDILRRDIMGVDDLIARVKKSSARMFSEADITKAIAQFSQYKIPIEEMDRTLAAVAKQSVRTGGEASQMLEQLTVGLGRGSAARLDDLGILLQEDQVHKEFAATIGKEASELTKTEKNSALLAESLRQLEENNINVDLTQSRTAALEGLGSTLEDVWNTITGGLADAAVGLFEWLGIIPERTTAWEQSLEGLEGTVTETGKAITDLANEALGFQRLLPEMVEALDDLNASLGRASTQAEQQQLARAFQTEFGRIEKALVRQNEILIKRAARWEAVRDRINETVAMEKEAELAQREYNEAVEDLKRLSEEAVAAREGIGKRTAEQIQVTAELGRIQKDSLAQLNQEYELREETRKIAGGMSDDELELLRTKKQIEAVDRSTIAGMLMLIGLTAERAELEERIRKAKGAAGRGGGRRRRQKPEDETIADIFASEKARLQISGALNAADRETLAIAEANVELDKISADLAAKKITARKAARLGLTIERELSGELAEIQRDEAASAERAAKAEEKRRAAREQERSAARDALGLGLAEYDRRRKEIAEAASKGFVTGEEGRKLTRKVQVDEDQAKVAAAYDLVADAASRAASSQDEVVAGFGRFAEAVGDHGDEIITVVGQMAAAMEAGGDAWVGAVDAAIGVAGALAASVIKDEQAKAIILGLMETAHAIAAFATEDYVGGAMHAIAAGLYYAAAGDSGSSKRASASAATAKRPSVAQAPPRSERGFVQNIYVNAPVVGGTPQELGTQVRKMSRRDTGTGFDAEAA